MTGEGLPVEGGTKELVPIPSTPSSGQMLETSSGGQGQGQRAHHTQVPVPRPPDWSLHPCS